MATGDNQIVEESYAWINSPYKFTQPVRYFKANDPYYWEVDNIPVKQLEENILWLKDQISASESLSGIGRQSFGELRPYANGASRTVYVNPGRFIARINDAYNKGISAFSFTRAALETLTRERYDFNISDDVINTLIGESIDNALGNNGLYEYLQHHNSEARALVDFALDWRHGYTYFLQNYEGINNIYNIPKNKPALWKQRGTSVLNGDFSRIDLQQGAVEFTRAWGATARTALVNSASKLEVEIPAFSDADYNNKSNFVPTVRVDLVFMYAHPVDASYTTIAKPNGDDPTTIYAPQLGVVKGAGLVSLSALGEDWQDSLLDTSGFLEDQEYIVNSDKSTNYLKGEYATLPDGTYGITSPIADNYQNDIGIENAYTNFPSPEDLMNLAPLLVQEFEAGDSKKALIGQTILPLAYVFVRKGKELIEPSDVLDIRPFFRTTELAYNERAGIAAANPPLSFANPAVGKHELRDTVWKSKRHTNSQINTLTTNLGATTTLANDLAGRGQLLGTGTIYGGTKWGVEGGLAALLDSTQGIDNTTSEGLLAGLKLNGHLPSNMEELPLYPGWDVNFNYFETLDDAGSRRYDRLFSTVIHGNASTSVSVGNIDQNIVDIQSRGMGASVAQGGKRAVATYGCLFIKKDIDFEEGALAGYSDYDVQANLVGCALNSETGLFDAGGQSDVAKGQTYTGISVQKRGKTGFTIIVALGTTCPHEGLQYFGKPAGYILPYYNSYADDSLDYNAFRDGPGMNRVLVLNHALITRGANLDGKQGLNESGGPYRGQTYDMATFSPILVTYPTVEFTVIGYKNSNFINNFYSTDGASGSFTFKSGLS